MKQHLIEEFEEQIIGYKDFVECPSYSPDLTPMDFFQWRYLKQQMYYPPIFQDLQRCIRDADSNVSPSMLQRVQREFQTRVHMCIGADEGKFEHRK